VSLGGLSYSKHSTGGQWGAIGKRGKENALGNRIVSIELKSESQINWN
jgi:hypothetical protein